MKKISEKLNIEMLKSKRDKTLHGNNLLQRRQILHYNLQNLEEKKKKSPKDLETIKIYRAALEGLDERLLHLIMVNEDKSAKDIFAINSGILKEQDDINKYIEETKNKIKELEENLYNDKNDTLKIKTQKSSKSSLSNKIKQVREKLQSSPTVKLDDSDIEKLSDQLNSKISKRSEKKMVRLEASKTNQELQKLKSSNSIFNKIKVRVRGAINRANPLASRQALENINEELRLELKYWESYKLKYSSKLYVFTILGSRKKAIAAADKKIKQIKIIINENDLKILELEDGIIDRVKDKLYRLTGAETKEQQRGAKASKAEIAEFRERIKESKKTSGSFFDNWITDKQEILENYAKVYKNAFIEKLPIMFDGALPAWEKISKLLEDEEEETVNTTLGDRLQNKPVQNNSDITNDVKKAPPQQDNVVFLKKAKNKLKISEKTEELDKLSTSISTLEESVSDYGKIKKEEFENIYNVSQKLSNKVDILSEKFEDLKEDLIDEQDTSIETPEKKEKDINQIFGQMPKLTGKNVLGGGLLGELLTGLGGSLGLGLKALLSKNKGNGKGGFLSELKTGIGYALSGEKAKGKRKRGLLSRGLGLGLGALKLGGKATLGALKLGFWGGKALFDPLGALKSAAGAGGKALKGAAGAGGRALGSLFGIRKGKTGADKVGGFVNRVGKKVWDDALGGVSSAASAVGNSRFGKTVSSAASTVGNSKFAKTLSTGATRVGEGVSSTASKISNSKIARTVVSGTSDAAIKLSNSKVGKAVVGGATNTATKISNSKVGKAVIGGATNAATKISDGATSVKTKIAGKFKKVKPDSKGAAILKKIKKYSKWITKYLRWFGPLGYSLSGLLDAPVDAALGWNYADEIIGKPESELTTQDKVVAAFSQIVQGATSIFPFYDGVPAETTARGILSILPDQEKISEQEKTSKKVSSMIKGDSMSPQTNQNNMADTPELIKDNRIKESESMYDNVVSNTKSANMRPVTPEVYTSQQTTNVINRNNQVETAPLSFFDA